MAARSVGPVVAIPTLALWVRGWPWASIACTVARTWGGSAAWSAAWTLGRRVAWPIAWTLAWPSPRRRDELLDLMYAWNDMAERIEGLMRGQRELLANVSHELRSPLARVRLALELFAARCRVRVAPDRIEGDLGELDRLIEDVLITSRSGHGSTDPPRRACPASPARTGPDRARSHPQTASLLARHPKNQ